MKQIPLHKRKLGREAPDLIKTQKYLTSPHFLGMNYHQTHSSRDLFNLTRPIVTISNAHFMSKLHVVTKLPLL